MSLHIELSSEGFHSAFIPRTSTIIPLPFNRTEDSFEACALAANEQLLIAIGVSAQQMNDAINGNLFVVDVVAVMFADPSIHYNKTKFDLVIANVRKTALRLLAEKASKEKAKKARSFIDIIAERKT